MSEQSENNSVRTFVQKKKVIYNKAPLEVDDDMAQPFFEDIQTTLRSTALTFGDGSIALAAMKLGIPFTGNLRMPAEHRLTKYSSASRQKGAPSTERILPKTS